MLFFSRLRKKTGHFFNMVEVALAMGVSAVGVSAAMGILPFAIKTSQVVAQNANATDIANAMFTEINRQVAIENLENNSSDGILPAIVNAIGSDGITTKLNYNQARDEKKFSGVGFYFIPAKDKKDESDNTVCSGIIAMYHFSENISVELEEHKGARTDYDLASPLPVASSAKELSPFFEAKYKVTITDIENDQDSYSDQLTYFEVEKSSDKINVKVINPKTGTETTKKMEIPTSLTPINIKHHSQFSSSLEKKYRGDKAIAKRVYIEISWPASAKLSRRKKKVFIQEFYMM